MKALPKHLARMAKAVLSLIAATMLALACTIEPPLHLPQSEVVTNTPQVITDIKVIWDIDVDWRAQWWYGWDDEDIRRWGELAYPEPTYFEVRLYYQGEEQSDAHSLYDAFTVYGDRFRRRYDFGYHDLLIWSNIDSKDGTQTVLIDESDYDRIMATTTKAHGGYRAPNRTVALKNQPDIFYDGYERDYYISQDPLDYDYYDEEEHAWVKLLHAKLTPVVYIYLVQVVIYNNDKAKIAGLSDDASITNMAEGVNLNTGHTTLSNVDVTFDMRMKRALAAREGRVADIIGSKFTTFGLCDMEAWHASRGAQYAGSRGDLANIVTLDLKFSNNTDSVFTYNVTDQMQRQAHGGVITIEIDADTITPPNPETNGSGSGFKPWVEDSDSITHEFGM